MNNFILNRFNHKKAVITLIVLSLLVAVITFSFKNVFFNSSSRISSFIENIEGSINGSINGNINGITETEELAKKIFRLHVIANSDSSVDQKLKADVRDAVIVYLEKLTRKVKNADETKVTIERNILQINNIASNIIKRKGFNYNVKSVTGKYVFPIKKYGDIVLPEGKYNALRIVIGEGSGANWWCVLFPPLCFMDITYGVVPKSGKLQLKQNLTQKEYMLVTSSNKETPVKIRFKLFDIFKKQ